MPRPMPQPKSVCACFLPIDYWGARQTAPPPVDVDASRTNTDDYRPALLPLSRGYNAMFAATQKRSVWNAAFAIACDKAMFLRDQLAAASGTSRCRFMT